MNLVGFNGETDRVDGKVTMPIETHRVTIYLKMIVIDNDSTYNVILGIPWFHDMKACPYSYRQLIKFSICRRIEKIMSDQVYTRSCFVSAMKGKTYENI